jgi:hypothetical protein
VAPLFGIAVGFALGRSEKDVYSFLRFYTLLNSVVLISVLVEYFGSDMPGLGGIQMDWVRYRQGYIVQMISGFYRSPDIMGLHAAHVVLFAAMLALRAKGVSRFGYVGLMFWAMVGLLLCGRRKMVGMPIVFLVMYVLISRWRGVSQFGGRVATLACIAIMAGAIFVAVQDEGQGEEYTDYALTMFTESHQRARDNVLGGVVGTLQQVGVLGGGLGTATQGKYYVGAKGITRATRGWQEDGVSRLFMELGVPGVLLMGVAVWQMLLALRHAVEMVPGSHRAQVMQIGLLSVIAADGVSYVFSHQQYSGDPVSALIVTLMMGSVLAMPRVFVDDLAKLKSLREAGALPRDPRRVPWGASPSGAGLESA